MQTGGPSNPVSSASLIIVNSVLLSLSYFQSVALRRFLVEYLWPVVGKPFYIDEQHQIENKHWHMSVKTVRQSA